MAKAKDFYTPGDINFTREEVIWLIKNLQTLRSGYWPTEESSYIDIPLRNKSRKHKAYFETPILYAAYIQMRLERCGRNGLILLAIEGWDMTVASLSSYFRLPEWVILRGRRQALGFVAGWKRKVR